MRYTQHEWQSLYDAGRAVPDNEVSGDDPQGWTVDGVYGMTHNPEEEEPESGWDDVIFVVD